MRHTLYAMITLTLIAGAAPQEARAQIKQLGQAPVLLGQAGPRYRMHGYAGGQLMGIGAVAQQKDEQEAYLSRFGGGIGLFAGVRLSQYFSLEGNWTFALHEESIPDPAATGGGQFESLYLMTFTADVKFHLPTNSPMEPYLQLGGGLLMSGGIYLDDRVAERPDSFAFGATYSAGCGLDIWVTRHISMGARVLYRGLALGQPVDEVRAEHPIRNLVHAISVDAFASIHF